MSNYITFPYAERMTGDIPQVEPGTQEGASYKTTLELKVIYYGAKDEIDVLVGIPLVGPDISGEHILIDVFPYLKWTAKDTGQYDARLELKTELLKCMQKWNLFDSKVIDVQNELLNFVTFDIPRLKKIGKNIPSQFDLKTLAISDIPTQFTIGSGQSAITFTQASPLSAELEEITRNRVNWNLWAGVQDAVALKEFAGFRFMELDRSPVAPLNDQGILDILALLPEPIGMMNTTPFVLTKQHNTIFHDMLRISLAEQLVFAWVRDKIPITEVRKTFAFLATHSIDARSLGVRLASDKYLFEQASGFYRPSEGEIGLRVLPYAPLAPSSTYKFSLRGIVEAASTESWVPLGGKFRLRGVITRDNKIEKAYDHESAVLSRITGIVYSHDMDPKILDIVYVHPSFIGITRDEPEASPYEGKIKFVPIEQNVPGLIDEEYWSKTAHKLVSFSSPYKGNLFPFQLLDTPSLVLDTSISPGNGIGNLFQPHSGLTSNINRVSEERE